MSRVCFPLARRRTLSASGLLLVLSLLLACGGAPAASPTVAAPSSQPAPAPPAATRGALATPPANSAVQPPLVPPVRVRVGVIGIAAEAGIYIAYEKGYFNAEGLAVELQPFRGGAERVDRAARSPLKARRIEGVGRALRWRLAARRGRTRAARKVSGRIRWNGRPGPP